MSSDAAKAIEGRKVLDAEGEKLGKIDEVYLHQSNDQPAWGVVKTGLVGGKRFVPLDGVNTGGTGDIRLGVTKDEIKAAPAIDDDEALSPETEAQLTRHYGTPAVGGGRGSADEGGETAGRAGGAGAVSRGTMAAARTRQKEEFGGLSFGSAFFGWLVAIGLGLLLTAIVAAAGTAIGLGKPSAARQSADTIGVVGGALLVLVGLVAYFAGGYVAGRMARFDGARQGFFVWLLGLLASVVLAVVGAVFGSEYNVLRELDSLPRVPVSEGSIALAGLITLGAVVLATLIGALLGGRAGTRFHDKVDRAAYDG